MTTRKLTKKEKNVWWTFPHLGSLAWERLFFIYISWYNLYFVVFRSHEPIWIRFQDWGCVHLREIDFYWNSWWLIRRRHLCRDKLFEGLDWCFSVELKHFGKHNQCVICNRYFLWSDANIVLFLNFSSIKNVLEVLTSYLFP